MPVPGGTIKRLVSKPPCTELAEISMLKDAFPAISILVAIVALIAYYWRGWNSNS